jgi:thymidylate synthase
MMNNTADKTYLDLVRHILDQGLSKEDRTGTGTQSVFGYQARYSLENFPAAHN